MSRNKLLQQGSLKSAIGVLSGIEDSIIATGIDPVLRHLVQLRVSQINGCVYCIGMHTREARGDGESNERLDKLLVWREAGIYSATEMAAFAWAEALTTRGGSSGLDELYAQLEQHFDRDAIATLTLIVVMINSWNRLQAVSHHQRF